MRGEIKKGSIARYAVFLALFFISGTLTSFGQYSGTYTLGATGHFTSFNEAVDSLVTYGVNGPVTINVDSGVYTEYITIHAIKGASATNTITFQSVGQDSTTVTLESASVKGAGGFSPTPVTWAVAFSGCKYVTFKWMTITRTGANPSALAVKIDSGACHNTITNCMLVGEKITKAPTGFAATYYDVVYASHTATFDDSFNNITNNYIKYGTYGIYLTYAAVGFGGTAGEAGVYDNILNNTIDSDYYGGIYLNYIDSSLISGNSITNIQAGPATGFGATTPYGIEITNSSVVYVNKNYINMVNGSDGIYLGAVLSSNRKNSIISNNMVIIGGSSGYGIYVPAGGGFGAVGNISYANFLFNSILINNTGAATASAGIYFASSVGSPTNYFYNNIAYNSGGGIAVNFVNNTDLDSVDYNDWYTKGATLGEFNTAKYTTANWVLNTSLDSHSVFVNPRFTSSTLLITSAAQCYDAGDSVLVHNDYFGRTRNPKRPCIGAVEFTLPANDAGVSSIDSPSSNFCKTGAANVYASITNFGIAALTTASVGWSVNGVAQKAYNWTGSILTGKSDSVIIGSYSFASGTSYSIKAWTYSPNGVTDSNPTNDTSLITGVQQGLSGTYSIGSTGAYSTIGGAIADLNTRGICGPVTFNIANGSYNEQDSIGTVSGASAINTITFQSQSGDSSKVNWNYAAGTARDYLLKINASAYITVKQITMHATGAANTTILVSILGSYHLTFSNCRFIGVNKSTSPSIVAAGTPTNGFFGLTYPGDLDSDITITNNYFSNNNNSIYLMGTGINTGEQTKNVISNNTSDSANVSGIYLQYQNNTIVTKNMVSGYGGAGGFNIIAGINLTNCDGNLNVSGNNVQGSGNIYGIYASTCLGGGHNQNEIYNNFIAIAQGAAGGGGGGGRPYGVYVTNSTYQDIYFNNINMYNTNANGYAIYTTFGAFGGAGGHSQIENNNFVNAGGGYAMYNSVATTFYDSVDYNNIYTTSATTLAYWGTKAYATLAAYTAASGQVYTQSLDPKYTSATDLHISNKILFGKGTSITGIATDIDGKTRFSPPTIGAVELSIHYNDAGLTVINNPADKSSICGGQSNINVTLKNFGLGKLTSAVINWMVNGTTQTAYNFTGSLLFDSTTTLNLPYNFTSGKTTITIWTTLPNGVTDSVTSNDSVTASIIVYPSPSALKTLSAQICTGGNTTIGIASNGSDNYSWVSSPSGFTSTDANPNVSPTANTTYVLTESNTFSCATIDSVAVTIDLPPVANAGKAQTVCAFNPATIGAAAVSGLTYSWTSNPAGYSDTTANPTVSPSVTTTYYLTAKNGGGCSDTQSVVITAKPGPAAFTGNNQAICNTGTTAIGTTGVNGNTYSWVSSPKGFTSTSANPQVSPTITTTYYLTETNSAGTGGCNKTDSVIIAVYNVPTVTFTAGTPNAGDIQFTVSDSTQGKYGWNFGDKSAIDSAKNPSHLYSANGTFKVTLTVTNAGGCAETDTADVLINNTSISPIAHTIGGLAVSPNPFSGNVAITYTVAQSGQVNAALYDLNGKEIMPLNNGTQTAGVHTMQLDGSALPAGVYIVRIIAGGYTANEKMIKIN